MSQELLMPEIQQGDIIEVKWNDQFKIYKLDDIACWNKNHSIKTINMLELKMPYSYEFDTKKELEEAKNKIRLKAKLIFKDGDKLLIKCSHDAVPYVVNVDIWNKKEMRTVHFNKMMST